MILLKNILTNVLKNRWLYTAFIISFNVFLYIFRFSTYRGLTTFISSLTDLDSVYSVCIDLMIFLLKLIVVQFLHSYTYYLLEKTVVSGIKSVFTNVVNKMVSYRIEFFKKNNSNKISQLWFYLSSVEVLVEKILLELPRITAFLCYYMYTIYTFSSSALLIVLPFNLICIRLLHPLSKRLYIYQKKRTELDLSTKNKLLETTSNIEHVKLCNQQDNEKSKIISIYNNYYDNKIKDKQVSSVLTLFSEVISDALMVVIYMFGCVYVLGNTIKPIELMYLAVHTGSFYYNLVQLKDIYNYYKKIKSKVKIVYEILSYKEVEDLNLLMDNGNNKHQKQLAFKNVSFKYEDGDQLILDQINFYFKKNMVNLLLGPNGCGKSTIIKLMLRLHEPTSGSISYYGKPITTKQIRSNITLVSQEPHIFNDTVWNNVVYGLDSVNEEKIIRLCGLIDSDRWIIENRDKPCGFIGKNLSGGEKKKIQLLNAICRDTETIVFDEPSNALDSNAISWFMSFVRKLCNKLDKTVIIITHDLRLVQLSDHTIDMNKLV